MVDKQNTITCSVSSESRTKLDRLGAHYHMTRTGVVEQLLRFYEAIQVAALNASNEYKGLLSEGSATNIEEAEELERLTLGRNLHSIVYNGLHVPVAPFSDVKLLARVFKSSESSEDGEGEES